MHRILGNQRFNRSPKHLNDFLLYNKTKHFILQLYSRHIPYLKHKTVVQHSISMYCNFVNFCEDWFWTHRRVRNRSRPTDSNSFKCFIFQ